MKPDGSGVRQLTTGHGDDREPRFSPDGARIAFASDRAFNGSYDIWVVDVASGELKQWTSSPADEFEPAWSPDGSEIAFISGTGANGTTIQAVDALGSRRTLVTGACRRAPQFAFLVARWQKDRLYAVREQPEPAHGFRERVGESNDVFPFDPSWLSNDSVLYTADGKLRVINTGSKQTREIPFQAEIALNRPAYERKRFDFDLSRPRQVKGIVSPALSPDGKRVVFEALNQLWVMEIGKKPEALTHDSYYKVDPAWSPDGKRIAYSSDKAGTEDIYVLDLATKTERRVTSDEQSAEVSSAWSPDGTMIAFQDHKGATFTVELATGRTRQVIEAQFAPSKPSWSANGKTIAIAALKKYTQRFREGTEPDPYRGPCYGCSHVHGSRALQVAEHAGRRRTGLLAGRVGDGIRDG